MHIVARKQYTALTIEYTIYIACTCKHTVAASTYVYIRIVVMYYVYTYVYVVCKYMEYMLNMNARVVH
jgi:hypothetical protein